MSRPRLPSVHKPQPDRSPSVTSNPQPCGVGKKRVVAPTGSLARVSMVGLGAVPAWQQSPLEAQDLLLSRSRQRPVTSLWCRLETSSVTAASGLRPHAETPRGGVPPGAIWSRNVDLCLCFRCALLLCSAGREPSCVRRRNHVNPCHPRRVTEAVGTPVTLSEVTQGQRALGSGGEQRRSPAAAPDRGLFLPEDHGPVTGQLSGETNLLGKSCFCFVLRKKERKNRTCRLFYFESTYPENFHCSKQDGGWGAGKERSFCAGTGSGNGRSCSSVNRVRAPDDGPVRRRLTCPQLRSGLARRSGIRADDSCGAWGALAVGTRSGPHTPSRT